MTFQFAATAHMQCMHGVHNFIIASRGVAKVRGALAIQFSIFFLCMRTYNQNLMIILLHEQLMCIGSLHIWKYDKTHLSECLLQPGHS